MKVSIPRWMAVAAALAAGTLVSFHAAGQTTPPAPEQTPPAATAPATTPQTPVKASVPDSDCLDCHTMCLETVSHCLQMGGKHADPHHIGLLLDCAEICQTSANFMLRQSSMHGRTCGVCAEVCLACAEDCEKFKDDEQMMACAEMCRQCASSCEEMAEMAA